MKNGKKLVNIYPTFPITSVNPPIRVAVKRVYMRPVDIRKCILARARVEEVLSNGKVINLGLESCFANNEPSAADTVSTKGSKKEEVENEETKEPETKQENRFDRKHSKKWKRQHRQEILAAAAESATDVIEAEIGEPKTSETGDSVGIEENEIDPAPTENKEVEEDPIIETMDVENL